MAIELDYMEYSSDANAQAAYDSSEDYALVDRTAGTIIGDMNTAGTQGKAFDGVTDAAYGDSEVAWKTANVRDAYIGKDWGSGVSRVVVGFKAWGSSDIGYHYNAGTNVTIKLYGKDTAPSTWDDGTLLATATTVSDANGLVVEKYDITITTAYRYHWIYIYSNNLPEDSFCAECQFFETSLQCYSESSIKQQGTYSLKVIADQTNSLNETLTRTVSPTVDLSGKDTIKFQAYASRTGSQFKIGIHDSGGTTTEYTVNIASANTWQTDSWNISGVSDANKDDIDQIIITIVNADSDNTFYFDNMYSELNSVIFFGSNF
ncbi:hypothetical protein LCGC14_1418230 [marine sediment metagenome]|uniref:Uncharacterized protein n=1 Tax=marine sediment metagenome TaxID=412755 RepID=A0A0F9KDE5_9ZZZZ